MALVIYYVVFIILGDIFTYFIGLGVEREWGSIASLWAFLALYFLTLWVAWVLAVWISAPESIIKAPAVAASTAPRA